MHLEDGHVPVDTVFVGHEEVKQAVGTKKVLKVFLIDTEGKRHLAATGEDLGDAHYHYRSTKPFSKYGVVDCHNRKELTMWLEMVIAESGGKDGPHLDADEENPEGVYFTMHKAEKAHMPDGRRINRWYLVDQLGRSHLAVIGIERDTKDGHYTYTAEEPFASRMPLQSTNQAGVFKWLQKWITHHAAGAAAPGAQEQGAAQAAAQPSAAGSAAPSGALGSGDSQGRNPPLFISLAAIRQARKSAAALLAANAVVVDTHMRAKPKAKQAAVSGTVHEPLPTGPKQKSLGIVQQNQIKKARKLQEDARTEQERLVSGHLGRLRRAAASELQGDNAAKRVAISWMQGSLSEDELDTLQHTLALLTAVLDLQQQHHHWQQQQQAGTAGQQDGPEQQQAGADAAGAPLQGPGQEQSQQQVSSSRTPPLPPLPQQQQQPGPSQPQQPQQQGTDRGGAGQLLVPEGAEMTDKELLAWLRQPGNERHHLRVTLECLKEIGAADLPAGVLLGHKVIQLVQRCLSEPQHESVRSMATHMLRRWGWQLAGHMQVLTHPAYMEDHLAVLDEDIAAGAVPVPTLPKHKQVLLNTPLPALPGSASGRMHYHTPAHSSHHQQQQQQLPPAPSSAPAGPQSHAAAHMPGLAATGLAGFQHHPGNNLNQGFPQMGLGASGQGFDALHAAGYGLLNPGQPGTPGFNTPMASFAGMYRSGSPALAAAPGSNGLQQFLLQNAAGNLGQQQLMVGCADPAVSAADAFNAFNGTTSSMLGWPYAAAGATGPQYAVSGGMFPILQQPNHQLQQQQQLHLLGLQQQYLQQTALGAGSHLPQQGLLQQPEVRLQQPTLGFHPQQDVLQQQWEQQWLNIRQPMGLPLGGQQQQQQQGLQ